jgi:hypothetical protein
VSPVASNERKQHCGKTLSVPIDLLQQIGVPTPVPMMHEGGGLVSNLSSGPQDTNQHSEILSTARRHAHS